MKKVIALATMACLPLTYASAEGYQVNTLSAKQGGMAHTGVAQKLGAESMYFNPAGLGFMNKTIDLSASVNAVMATATAIYNGEKYVTDNGASTPMMVNAAFRIYDNLYAGLNFYIPYGSGINWTDNWPGANLTQSVDLKTYTVQPTIGWRITPKLSIGAGFMISWGKVDLNKGLIVPSSMDTYINYLKSVNALPAATPAFGSTVPASVNLAGTSNLAYGANIGIMYDFNEKWTIGANYRTKQVVKVKSGTATVSYANETAESLLENTLNLINKSNFSAKMPMPAVFTFGTSYRPIKPLLLAFDAQLTQWNAYKTLDIEFASASAFDQHITKDYKNSWAFRLGGQYTVTHRFDVRAGLILDLSPVNSDYYNPETPGMTKIEPSVGFSFRPTKSLSIDFSFLYVKGLGADNVKVAYDDLILQKMGLDYVKEFKADYRVHAFNPSLGISYSF